VLTMWLRVLHLPGVLVKPKKVWKPFALLFGSGVPDTWRRRILLGGCCHHCFGSQHARGNWQRSWTLPEGAAGTGRNWWRP